MDEPVSVPCPSCQGANVVVSAQGIARCGDCGGEFLVQTQEPDETASAAVLDYRTPSARDDDELSELRIRDVSNLRRAEYRERSYWIIGAVLCLMGVVKLSQIAWAAWTRDLTIAGVGDALAAVAAGMVFVVALRRIAALTREIRQWQVKEIGQPPDFSNLGDGSQRVRDLEAMAARENDRIRDPNYQAKPPP